MNKEDIIINKIMEMQKSMGGFEANIKDMRSDITKIEDTLKDSFVFPVTNRIIAITAIVGGSGIGISELLMG
ncbi:hypothetical protein KAR91_44705 [Candidatus Pacearchaeota archaeon]|nr:hypothetical protein [Candidatus Pacearchaeota archaeon]